MTLCLLKMSTKSEIVVQNMYVHNQTNLNMLFLGGILCIQNLKDENLSEKVLVAMEFCKIDPWE
jgi:4-hydroxy-3-methylbut-2-enyl diphosphate reductase IspH